MYLRQIQYFASVARARSFMGASRMTHVSQPALSFQVKQLEEMLGVELLSRHSRGVGLTEAGAVFLERAEQILGLVREAEAALGAFRKRIVGNVTIGLTPTAGRALTPILLDTAMRETELKITLRQGMSNELLSETQSGTLNLAFCYDPPRTERLRTLPLYREGLFLVGPPDLIGASDAVISFSELTTLPLVLDNRNQSIRRLMETVAQRQNLRLPAGIEIEPINLKREMVVHHRRCTIVPFGLFGDEIRQGDLAARPICRPVLRRTMNLVVGPGLPRQIETFLLSMIRSSVAVKIAEGGFGWAAVERAAGETPEGRREPHKSPALRNGIAC